MTEILLAQDDAKTTEITMSPGQEGTKIDRKTDDNGMMATMIAGIETDTETENAIEMMIGMIRVRLTAATEIAIETGTEIRSAATVTGGSLT